VIICHSEFQVRVSTFKLVFHNIFFVSFCVFGHLDFGLVT
jgi:hypothetical protein